MATLDLYVNTSSPSKRKALVAGFSTLSAPVEAEFFVRTPVLTVRIHPMTVASNSRTGVTADWGETPAIKFGGKVSATYVESDETLFFSNSFVKDDTDEGDIFYEAEVSLNTEEFIAAFAGSREIALITEIEVDGDTVAQQSAVGVWDVLRDGDPDPEELDFVREGSQALTADVQSGTVVLSPAMTSAPTVIQLTVEMPDGAGAVLFASPHTITAAGFSFVLSSEPPASGYKLHWKASL